MTSDIITLFTAQTQVVLDAIERDGYSRVKWEYIRRKYADESWIFQQAYSFFAQNAPRYVTPPEGAESGIWCFCDWRLAIAGTGCSLIEMEVPRDQAVLFDSRLWNRMLNLQYIGKDEADEAAFEQRITSMGLKSSADAFATAFYPTVKREVTQSWQRLFGSAEKCPEAYIEAGLWEIRREWIKSVRNG
jgi:hypothetical protein